MSSAATSASRESSAVAAEAEMVADAHRRMTRALGTVIIGQEYVLDLLLTALFCKGHCILEGVPGLAKTLMISSLSKLLSMSFNRIQFTPDLMPSDITGTEILQENKIHSTGSSSHHRRSCVECLLLGRKKELKQKYDSRLGKSSHEF